MKKANLRAKLPNWFVTKYKNDLCTTSSSQLKQTPNLILVGLGTEQDPDLPPHLFNDLERLAKETRQTVEGIFALEQTGRKTDGEAGKFTVQPDGTILQDSTITGDSMYLRKNHFSGPNSLQPLS